MMCGEGLSIASASHGLAAQEGKPRLYVGDLPRLMMVMAVALAIMGCSRDTAWRYVPNDLGSAGCWISPDRMRLLIVDRASNKANYFDNTPGRLSFTYSVSGVPGEWLAARQDGLFQVGSNIMIGVAVYHTKELPGSVDESILNRAAEFLERDYRQLFGSIAVTVTPFQPTKLKAIQWDAIWEMTVEGERCHVKTTKILMEYNQQWVIQISAMGTKDDSVIVDQIVNSFMTTDSTNYFWAEIDQILLDIGGFSRALDSALRH